VVCVRQGAPIWQISVAMAPREETVLGNWEQKKDDADYGSGYRPGGARGAGPSCTPWLATATAAAGE